jgi:hypothetical protein
MKHFILLFSFSLISIFISAQCCPYIGTATMIPAFPTTSDYVKIVTNITTPNQGTLVDLTFTVSHSLKKIDLAGCYSDGMLPATQNYIDTFYIGQLQAGTYTIHHKAFLSQAQQWCNKTDSNSVNSTATVVNITSIKEDQIDRTFLFPNPVSDKLYFPRDHELSEVELYSVQGTLVKKLKLEGLTMDVSELTPGFYFVRFLGKEKEFYEKFLKN